MRGKKFSIGLGTALAIFTVTLLVTSTWAAAHESVLHSFNNNGTDGANPYATLAVDAAGNFYGTTVEGGIHNLGSVFELSPREGGGWTEKVLHSFGHGTDGTGPYANLVIDAVGNLYGTSYAGGINPCFETGCGTVYELSPRQGGGWTQTVLHNFGNSGDDLSGHAYPTREVVLCRLPVHHDAPRRSCQGIAAPAWCQLPHGVPHGASDSWTHGQSGRR